MSNRRFHIGRDGQPHECTAEAGKCPLGGEHYSTMETATHAAEKLVEQHSESSSSLKKGKDENKVVEEAKKPMKYKEKMHLYKNGKIISLTPGDYAILTANESGWNPDGLTLAVSEKDLPATGLGDLDSDDAEKFLDSLDSSDASDGIEKMLSRTEKNYHSVVDEDDPDRYSTYSEGECYLLSNDDSIPDTNPIIYVRANVSFNDNGWRDISYPYRRDTSESSESNVEFYVVSREHLENNGIDSSNIDFRHFDKLTKIDFPVGIDGEGDYDRHYEIAKKQDSIEAENGRTREERETGKMEKIESVLEDSINDRIKCLDAVDSHNIDDYVSALDESERIRKDACEKFNSEGIRYGVSMENHKSASYEYVEVLDAEKRLYKRLAEELKNNPDDSVNLTGYLESKPYTSYSELLTTPRGIHLLKMINNNPDVVSSLTTETREKILKLEYVWSETAARIRRLSNSSLRNS